MIYYYIPVLWSLCFTIIAVPIAIMIMNISAAGSNFVGLAQGHRKLGWKAYRASKVQGVGGFSGRPTWKPKFRVEGLGFRLAGLATVWRARGGGGGREGGGGCKDRKAAKWVEELHETQKTKTKVEHCIYSQRYVHMY